MALPLGQTFVSLSVTQALLLSSVLTGVGLCAVAVHVYREWREPGVAAFAVFLVAFGGGTAVSSAVLLAPELVETDSTLWSPLSVATWAISMPPWIVFALQYTGVYTRITWKSGVLLFLPVAGVPFLFSDAFGLSPTFLMLGFLGTIALLAYMIIGCYILVRTAHEYGHLSTTQGAIIASVPVIVLIESNLSGTVALTLGLVTGLAVHTGGIGLAAGALLLGVYGYGKFESSPAVGTIGERAIVRQTDELMFVIDDDERIIKLNQTAADRLGVSMSGVLGDQLESVLGYSIADVQDEEVIELLTDGGSFQFDPVVSELTDQHDRQIGYTLALHDVTELELREQRLEVLNRVLRHNLRNQVEVIQANAEILADGDASRFADSILDSAERLTELGRSARSVDQIVSRPSKTATVEVKTLVEDTVERISSRSGPHLSMTLENGSVETDDEALEAAVESAIEGAFSRAEQTVEVTLDSTSDGYVCTVTDDGPGIPDDELAAVTAGTETSLQHATGLELWRLKWAVTKLNGELSFENDDGTTIEITIPDQSVATATTP